jgi:ketosteroid isomerase-like protein
MADAEQTQAEASERERNLELLRRGTEAYNQGDLSFVTELAADDIEVYADSRLINSGTFKGRDEFLRWMQNWSEAWSEVTLQVRDVQIVEDRFMLVEVFQTGVGSSSGVPVEMNLVQLFEIGGGEIKRFHLYPDREPADEALARLRAA